MSKKIKTGYEGYTDGMLQIAWKMLGKENPVRGERKKITKLKAEFKKRKLKPYSLEIFGE